MIIARTRGKIQLNIAFVRKLVLVRRLGSLINKDNIPLLCVMKTYTSSPTATSFDNPPPIPLIPVGAIMTITMMKRARLVTKQLDFVPSAKSCRSDMLYILLGTSFSNTNVMAKTRKRKTYKKQDFNSGDGMLTAVWGPSMWHYLHIMSFNYPIKPTVKDKKHYRDFILSLQHTLPCRHCRMNLKRNFKAHPLRICDMKNRHTFSRYIYRLHEVVNKMLGKKSGLSYCEVRERYEHFRARCTEDKPKLFNFKKTRKKKEKGCTEPLYGKKAKCVIKIVPQEEKCKTLQIDKKCIKSRE